MFLFGIVLLMLGVVFAREAARSSKEKDEVWYWQTRIFCVISFVIGIPLTF